MKIDMGKRHFGGAIKREGVLIVHTELQIILSAGTVIFVENFIFKVADFKE
jgi:hypothetical protein